MTDVEVAPNETACGACPRLQWQSPAPRDRIVATSRFVVAHAFNANLEGWLVVLPRRHVVSLDQFDDVETAELGPLLRGVTAALMATTGCEKTYVLLLAEMEGFQHVHFHVVPRGPDLPDAYRGSRIFGLLGNPELDVVSPERMNELAIALRGHLADSGIIAEA
ncbi:MAG TPA: HIT domain-containing protein [Acidimicrobiales bacterium]|jgi:diadenosine tetraphosphate (Ap4A) HIT family hydrolase|nr:HIT domain-containing protein [Acidimicrobiales bacterium]